MSSREEVRDLLRAVLFHGCRSRFCRRSRQAISSRALSEEKFMALRDRPAYIIRMRAKPGLGDKRFEVATVGMEKIRCLRPPHHRA